jgi:hypothetical protein
MFSSLWKVMPFLTIGLGVGLEAQTAKAPQNDIMPTYQTASNACGLHEGDCCLARSCKCTNGKAVEFDFLYWTAKNPGFSCYAYEQKNALFDLENIEDQDFGSIVRLDSKWDPGFRFGAGWNTNFDRWDVFVDWTWYRNHSKESRNLEDASDSELRGFYPISFFNESSTPYQNVSSSWHMLHNAIDIELGRAYYITKSLSLRPHLGFRGGCINQNSKTHFNQILISGSASVLTTDIINKAKNNFWGVGPRIGIHSQWHIANSSWSILGKASTSLLLGETRTHFQNKYFITNETDYVIAQDFKDNISQLVPNLQIFLGLDWGSCLECDMYYLGINAGWETDIYWNQYNVPATIQNKSVITGLNNHSTEAVTMGGLTVNVHLDF